MGQVESKILGYAYVREDVGTTSVAKYILENGNEVYKVGLIRTLLDIGFAENICFVVDAQTRDIQICKENPIRG